MSLSTHILDTRTGLPASGVALTLTDPTGTTVTATTTDDGRAVPGDELPGGQLRPGVYRITFATGEYHRAQGVTALHPEVTIALEVPDPAPEHLHVPLLLSPFGYTTYRGS